MKKKKDAPEPWSPASLPGEFEYPAGHAYPAASFGSSSSGQSLLHPLRLLRVVRDHWKIISLVAGLGLLLGIFAYLRADRVYVTSALMELSMRRPRVISEKEAVIEDRSVFRLSAEEIFNTQLQKFRGQRVMDIAAEFLREENVEGLEKIESLAGFIGSRANFSMMRETQIMRVEVRHTDPALAATMANVLSRAIIRSVEEDNRAAADAAVNWLERQSANQRSELEASDRALLEFTREHNVDLLTARRGSIEATLQDLNTDLARVAIESANKQEVFNALSEITLTPDSIGRLPANIPRQTEVSQAINEWLSATAERDALLSRYTPNHPKVRALNDLIDVRGRQLEDALLRARATAEADYKLLSRQGESLQKLIEEQTKLATDLDRQLVENRTELAALKRARDAIELTYNGLLTRIEEARLAADETTTSIKQLEQARVPSKPFKPKLNQMLATGLMFGLLAGVGAALGFDILKDHILSTEDVLLATGVEVLASVPHAENFDRHEIALASRNEKMSMVSEAFAGLRAMLESVQYREGSQVILIASTIPGEGKTVTACNLAVAFARSGQRTLLIDFDLRRPQIPGIFPMPEKQLSLADALEASEPPASWATYSYASDCPHLTVIAGRVSRTISPADLVANKNAESLILWAREHFDRIILDAPPLGLISEPLVLARLADFVLLATRYSHSRKRLVQHTVDKLRQAGVETMGAILNDMSVKSSFGQNPYYYYHRHYGEYGKQR